MIQQTYEIYLSDLQGVVAKKSQKDSAINRPLGPGKWFMRDDDNRPIVENR